MTALPPQRWNPPPLWQSLAVTVVMVAAMGVLRFSIYPNQIVPLVYTLPLLIALWHRDRRQLWFMAVAFVAMLGTKFYLMLPTTSLEQRFDQQFFVVMQLANTLVPAAVIHMVIRYRLQLEGINNRLQETNSELEASNEELAAREEEITRQNEELQVQAEEMQQQSEELQTQAVELSTLNEELTGRENTLQGLLQVIGAASNETQVLEETCVIATTLLGEPLAAAILDSSDGDFVVRAHSGLARDATGTLRLTGPTLAKLVRERGQSAHIPDLTLRPDIHVPPNPRGEPFRSILAAPLRRHNGEIGVLEVYCTKPQGWTDRQAAMLEWLAAQCERAWELVHLRNELEKRTHEAELRSALIAKHESELEILNQSLDKQVRERTAELEERGEEMRRLASQLTSTEHRERKRLAQVLHDDLQQLLVAARMRLSLSEVPDGAWKQQTQDLLLRAIDLSRSLVTELSPPILFQERFETSLRWLARRMEQQHNLKVEIDCDEVVEPPSEDWRIFLFTAIGECLFNVIKHAGVKHARVTLRCADQHLRVCVVDDGEGFDMAKAQEMARAGESFGLFSIRQRTALLGGYVKIQSAAGKGTSIEFVVPFNPETSDGSPTPPKAPAVVSEPAPTHRPPDAGRAGCRKIRVIIADDHQMLREGVAALLSGHEDIELVAEAVDGKDAVELAMLHRPDVVVMDISMPRMSGIDATRILRERAPGVRVIGMSMHDRDDMAASMFNAGAVGYVTKDGPTEQLVGELRRVMSEVTDSTP